MACTAVGSSQLGEQVERLLRRRHPVADQPAPHDRPGAPDPAPTVDVDHPPLVEQAVDGVESCRHLVLGGDVQVEYRVPHHHRAGASRSRSSS